MDELRLQGTLHLPDCARPNLVVGSHGLYSSGESPKQVELARRCCRRGIAYFRIDHRGCGRSQGRFETVTTLAGRRRDLLQAVAHLRGAFELGNGLGLFGSSFGGATCLAAASALRPQRLVTLAAPVDSRSILSAAENHASPVERLFLNEAFQFDLRKAIRPITGLLVMHGDRDEVIPPAHADIIFESVRDPKERLIISGGDHRLSRRKDQRQFITATLAWFKPMEAPSWAGR
ncbi:MAG: alpha/beta fold hydrolase [Desulfobacterales bacterium]